MSEDRAVYDVGRTAECTNRHEPVALEIKVNDAFKIGLTSEDLGDFLCRVLDEFNKYAGRPGFSIRNTPSIAHDVDIARFMLERGREIGVPHGDIYEKAARVAASMILLVGDTTLRGS